MRTGTLYLVATPIGNLSDITLRALDVLRSVHIIAAEDTRHTRKLLSRYEIHKPLASYHTHNMHQCGPELLEKIRAGQDIALVTDAGTPGISDPGALLVREALKSGIQVSVIPGPTALIMALVASGLPTHPFAFLGFPPKRGSKREHFFSSYASLSMTLILYESPHRFKRIVEDMLSHWGNRRIVIARELTKKYEELFRGTVTEAQQHYPDGIRGEITIVVEGAKSDDTEERQIENWREELYHLLKELNHSVKDATKEIVGKHKLSRQDVYREALKIRERE
jgi:16S rRNA (cytidine1402-2'-O)-methyltransferase